MPRQPATGLSLTETRRMTSAGVLGVDVGVGVGVGLDVRVCHAGVGMGVDVGAMHGGHQLTYRSPRRTQ